MEKKRVNIMIDSNLWKEAQMVAERMGMSASAYTSYCIGSNNEAYKRFDEVFRSMSPEQLSDFYARFQGGK